MWTGDPTREHPICREWLRPLLETPYAPRLAHSNFFFETNRNRRRWCGRHAAERDSLSAGLYAIAAGVFASPKSLAERAACRIAWAWDRILPWDFHELSSFLATVCPVAAGSAITPLAFARCFLAHCIKWPPLLRHWRVRTADSVSARDLVLSYVELLKMADGRKWPVMFSGMNVGRSPVAVSGIVVHGIQMGLLRRPSCKEKANTTAVSVLRLGMLQTKYVLEEDIGAAVQVVEHIMQCAAQIPLVWPADSEDIRPFATGMGRLLRNCRCGPVSDSGGKLAGFNGGQTSGSYNVLHFLRCWLYVMERAMGQAFFARLPMAELALWTPDQKEVLPKMQNATYLDARAKYGCSPLLLSMVFCMVSALSEADMKKVTRLTDGHIFGHVFRWEQWMEHNKIEPLDLDMCDFFSPVPKTLTSNGSSETSGPSPRNAGKRAADSRKASGGEQKRPR